METSTHLKIIAADPGDVTGSGSTTVTVNGRTMTSNPQFTAKWLSASCPSSKKLVRSPFALRIAYGSSCFQHIFVSKRFLPFEKTY